MNVSIKQGITVAATGLFGLTIGVMIASGTGILGGPAYAGEEQSSEQGGQSEVANSTVTDAFEKAGIPERGILTNASGQTYGTDHEATNPKEIPDLVAVWVDSETVGFIYKEDLYPELFSEKPIGLQLDGESTVTQTYITYESDGKTVIKEGLKLTE